MLEETDYPCLRLCVVDNGSTSLTACTELKSLRERGAEVVSLADPFNYATLNNLAVGQTGDEVLCFLNDDIEVVEPGWLKAMVSLAVRPEVGAVGARLLYPDGRIQHAGVTLGLGALGVAGHDFRGAPGDTAGPQGRLQVVREASAVTGACLVVERAKFEAAGRFDSKLAVAFNDVDLCLRLAERGWKTVWTPDASLIHVESASRGPAAATRKKRERLEAEAALMRERWGERLLQDPYYHPGLSLTGERFALGEGLRSQALR